MKNSENVTEIFLKIDWNFEKKLTKIIFNLMK